MKINKIQKFAFLSVCISCLASFSFFSQTVALNKEDSYENNQESPDSNFEDSYENDQESPDSNFDAKLQSAYDVNFLFIKALAQAHGLAVPNFDETSYIDMNLERKRALELMRLVEKQVPDFKFFDNAISDANFSEETLAAIHERLLALPNGAKLVELFDKAHDPRIQIYFAELYVTLKKSYPKGYAEYFGRPSEDKVIFSSQAEAVKAIMDRLYKLTYELSDNFSSDKFKEIKQELAKLPNSTKLIKLFSNGVEKDIKPYINEREFENMLLRYMYLNPNIDPDNKSFESISELERFWISDAARRPYSERAKLILAKLDKTGELNKLYDGLFR